MSLVTDTRLLQMQLKEGQPLSQRMEHALLVALACSIRPLGKSNLCGAVKKNPEGLTGNGGFVRLTPGRCHLTPGRRR